VEEAAEEWGECLEEWKVWKNKMKRLDTPIFKPEEGIAPEDRGLLERRIGILVDGLSISHRTLPYSPVEVGILRENGSEIVRMRVDGGNDLWLIPAKAYDIRNEDGKRIRFMYNYTNYEIVKE